MKLVIDIPENEIPTKQDLLSIDLCFFNGKVSQCDYPFIELPKGHGRLIDADKLELDYDWCEYENDNGQLIILGYQAYSDNAINTAPTIIEADKENE